MFEQKTKIRLLAPGFPYFTIWLWMGAHECVRLIHFSIRTLCFIMGYKNKRLLHETMMRRVTDKIGKRQLWPFGHGTMFPESDPVSWIISERISPAWNRPIKETWLLRIDGQYRDLRLTGKVLSWHPSCRDARAGAETWPPRVAASTCAPIISSSCMLCHWDSTVAGYENSCWRIISAYGNENHCYDTDICSNLSGNADQYYEINCKMIIANYYRSIC